MSEKIDYKKITSTILELRQNKNQLYKYLDEISEHDMQNKTNDKVYLRERHWNDKLLDEEIYKLLYVYINKHKNESAFLSNYSGNTYAWLHNLQEWCKNMRDNGKYHVSNNGQRIYYGIVISDRYVYDLSQLYSSILRDYHTSVGCIWKDQLVS